MINTIRETEQKNRKIWHISAAAMSTCERTYNHAAVLTSDVTVRFRDSVSLQAIFSTVSMLYGTKLQELLKEEQGERYIISTFAK